MKDCLVTTSSVQKNSVSMSLVYMINVLPSILQTSVEVTTKIFYQKTIADRFLTSDMEYFKR